MAATAQGTTTLKPEKPSSCDDGGAMCAAIAIIVLAIIGVLHLFLDAWLISDHLLKKHDPVEYNHWPIYGPGCRPSWEPSLAPEYNVTITAITGLDPAKIHAGGLLHPAFNLTLLVASPHTAEYRECVKPGTTVEVSYRPYGVPVEVSYLRSGVPLAIGPAPTFCVDVGERREEGSIVAWGDGVGLPELLLDNLATDMLLGAPEFGVRLIPVPQCGCGELFCHDTMDVILCWARVGRGPAPCSVTKERVSFPPVPRPGAVKDSAEANLPQPPTP